MAEPHQPDTSHPLGVVREQWVGSRLRKPTLILALLAIVVLLYLLASAVMPLGYTGAQDCNWKISDTTVHDGSKTGQHTHSENTDCVRNTAPAGMIWVAFALVCLLLLPEIATSLPSLKAAFPGGSSVETPPAIYRSPQLAAADKAREAEGAYDAALKSDSTT